MKIGFYLIFVLFIIGCNPINGQTLPTGKFYGYENMIRLRHDLFIPGVYSLKNGNKYTPHSNERYHEVTIEIRSDTNIVVTKEPILFKNGRKQYSDSTFGFFYYEKCALKDRYLNSNKHQKQYIYGRITRKNYTRKVGTAVPRNVNISYEIISTERKKLILKTEFGEIEFRNKKRKKVKGLINTRT